MTTLLFLYGTLKRGGRNHHLMTGQTFLGPARTLPRYRLYDSGHYPCLVEAEEQGRTVVGELWRVDAAVLKQLDEFEEVEHTFARRGIALEGVAEPVFAYFYCGEVGAYADCGESWS